MAISLPPGRRIKVWHRISTGGDLDGDVLERDQGGIKDDFHGQRVMEVGVAKALETGITRQLIGNGQLKGRACRLEFRWLAFVTSTCVVMSSGTRVIGAPDSKTILAASGSQTMLCSASGNSRRSMLRGPTPPIMVRWARFWARRGSFWSAKAILVSGPMAIRWILPGLDIT